MFTLPPCIYAHADGSPVRIGLRCVNVPPLDLRSIPLAETRVLRRDVLRPYMTVDQLAEHEPGDAVAFGVFQGNELIAVGLVGPEGETPGDWRVRGMATAPHARRRGAGTKLLQALVQHAADNGATRVWCNARTPALSLYERAGFVATSDEFETPRIGPHYRMELHTTNGG